MAKARLSNRINGNDRPVRRDERGRFTPGTRGGPGNPLGARVHEWRQALADCVSPADVRAVVGQLLKAAKAGEPWAIIEILNRTIGRPAAFIMDDESQDESVAVILEQIQLVYKSLNAGSLAKSDD